MLRPATSLLLTLPAPNMLPLPLLRFASTAGCASLARTLAHSAGGASLARALAHSSARRRALSSLPPPPPGAATLLDPVTGKRVAQHAMTTGGKKGLTGFSFPVPRRLEDIIKYALLEREPAAKIKEAWNVFHDARVDSVATTWTAAEFAAVMAASRRNKSMLYPVFKGEGRYFTLYAEWQDKYLIMAFLEDYRRSPGGAEPYFSVAVYDDFLAKKGLALVRGDYSAHLTKRDAAHLLNLVAHFHLREPRQLELFNREPAAFSWEGMLATCPRPPEAGSVAADPRKATLVKHS